MKTYLLREATIIDKRSTHHGRRLDVLVRNGIIEDFGESLETPQEAEEIRLPGLHLSPGWVDLFCFCGEPGYPERETLESLSRASVAGGFAHVLLMPDNDPMPDNEQAVKALLEAAAPLPISLHVAGCLTMKAGGESMAELLTLRDAGARVFSDGLNSVSDNARFTSILEYAAQTTTPVFHRPGTPSLEKGLWAAESPEAIAAGVKGIPEHAEALGLYRDVTLARYTGACLHLQPITTKAALEIWKILKDSAPAVTLGTAAPYLYFEDPDPATFDPNLILRPPLRHRQDVKALREACRDGWIIAVASGHTPLNPEIKDHEPDLTRPGMTTLETAFAMTWTALSPLMPLVDVVALFSSGPASVLGLDYPVIEKGQPAVFTLFDPNITWTFTEKDQRSLSLNTPLFGHTLKGRPYGILNKGYLHLNEPCP
jgi:dihydroorotase